MPELVHPDVRYHESFLAAMAEFADEGRTGDGSMIGAHLERHGDTWAREQAFAAYVASLRAEENLPSRPGFVCQTSGTTSAGPAVGRDTPPRCWPPRCRWPTGSGSTRR